MRHLRHVVFICYLLFCFTIALTTFVNSTFLGSIVGASSVGIYYAIGSAITIYLISRSVRTLGRYGNRFYFLMFATIHALSLLCIVLPTNPVLKVFAFVSYLFSGNVLLFSLDIFFERVSGARGRGGTRGMYLLLGNIGWVFTPFVSSIFIDRFGYAGLYAMALGLFSILTICVEIGLRKYKEFNYSPHHMRPRVMQEINKASLKPVIIANFILQFFYSWMVVYTPVYLVTVLGFSWHTIGIIFAIMLSSFVILDYPLGKLADKLGTEKELASFGFLLMAGSVFALSYFHMPSAVIVAIILFISRIGAATVETMTEIHFFKSADDDPRLLSVFRDLRPFAYLIAPLIALPIMAFASFKLLFAVLGVILIIGYFVSLRIEKTRRWWKQVHVE